MRTKRIIVISLMILVLVPIIYVSLSIISGSMKIFVVLSESMVPVMSVGDAILITNMMPENIKVGDIIAFDLDGDGNTVVSHRVVDIKNNDNINNGNISFQTKGDNVQNKDPFVVDSKKLIGKAIFKLPYAGYLTKFSRKPILFLIFSIIPSIIIIFDEIKKMTKSSIHIRHMEIREEKRRRKEDRAITRINYIRFVAIILIGTIATIVMHIPYIDPKFWTNFTNFSHTNSYLMSGISYIIIQIGILSVASSLWLQNRYNKNSMKEFKKGIKRGIYNIRRTIG